jgi:phytoene desaturase
MPATNDKKRKVAVIGGGLGGLACAARLAHAGFHVVVFEKNESVGGKIHEVRQDGYVWDTGPTLLTMPQALDGLWQSVDRRMEDYISLIPLESTCRHRWTDGTVIDEDAALWQRKDVARFVEYGRAIYEAAGDFFIHNPPGHWWRRFRPADIARLRHLPKLTPGRTMHDVVRRHFSDPHLVQAFDRFATWNGSSPFKTPSVFSFLPYLLAKYGGWHVKGGQRRIIAGLLRLAEEFGVEFRLNTEITGLHRSAKKGFSVAIDGSWEKFDLVICNQDAVQSHQSLMPREPAARFRKALLERLPLSSSAFVLCLGVTKKYDDLAHHNIFHPDDTAREFHEIFKMRAPSADPTISLCVSSRAEPERAPDGCDNWVVHVNAPATRLSFDWKENGESYADRIVQILENKAFPGLRQNIAARHVISPLDIRTRYNCYAGSIHGFASHSFRAAFARIRIDPPEIPGLYFVGGSTHPGGGVPFVISSAQIAARKIIAGEYRH